GIRRKRAKAASKVSVDMPVAHGRPRERVPRLLFGRTDRRVDDHSTSQRVAILGRNFHCHKAAEAVADDKRTLAQLRSGNNGSEFFGAKLRAVVPSPATVAHADKSIAATRKSE